MRRKTPFSTTIEKVAQFASSARRRAAGTRPGARLPRVRPAATTATMPDACTSSARRNATKGTTRAMATSRTSAVASLTRPERRVDDEARRGRRERDENDRERGDDPQVAPEVDEGHLEGRRVEQRGEDDAEDDVGVDLDERRRRDG